MALRKYKQEMLHAPVVNVVKQAETSSDQFGTCHHVHFGAGARPHPEHPRSVMKKVSLKIQVRNARCSQTMFRTVRDMLPYLFRAVAPPLPNPRPGVMQKSAENKQARTGVIHEINQWKKWTVLTAHE